MGAVPNAFNGQLQDVLFQPVQVLGQQVLVLLSPNDQRLHADLVGDQGKPYPNKGRKR
jgi:hypothetical protein